jgi:hypothetical protein
MPFDSPRVPEPSGTLFFDLRREHGGSLLRAALRLEGLERSHALADVGVAAKPPSGRRCGLRDWPA